MIRQVVTPLLAVLFLSCGDGHTSDPTLTSASVINESDREVLKEWVTLQWPKAYADQDTVLLDQLLHDKFQLIDDQGEKYSKQDELDYIKKYGVSYDSFVFEISRLDLFDNGTAIVSGVGTITGSDISGEYLQTYQSSTAMVKEQGRWQAINSHVSGVKEERDES